MRSAPQVGSVLLAASIAVWGAAGVADAAFQGRNGRIAYVECSGTCAGLCEIKTVNPDGTDARTLTSGREPAWAPNGAELAYTASGSVYVVNADGSNNRLVPGGGRKPAWSPDGTRLVLDVDYELWAHDLASNARQQITFEEHGEWVPGIPYPATTWDNHSDPVWQPTGDLIVFARERGVSFGAGSLSYLDLWAVHADGTGLHQLTELGYVEQQQNDPGIEDMPDWSPDGSAVAYRRDAAWPHGQQVYTVPANGGDPTQLTQPADDQGDWPPYPAWSPSGGQIAYLTRFVVDGALAYELRVRDIHPAGPTVPLVRSANPLCGTDWQVIPGTELIVNSIAAHAHDVNTGDGLCRTGETLPNGDPECTLVAAIDEANAAPNRDVITFDIPGAGPHVIDTGWDLLEVTQPVVIDATTQPGLGRVQIYGGTAGWGQTERPNGLTVRGGHTTIRGLSVTGYRGWGIALVGGAGNVLEGNYVGIALDGVHDVGNGRPLGDVGYGGILVRSADTRIGGSDHDEGVCNRACNLIAGNGPEAEWADGPSTGLEISGAEATGTQVYGNFIGTDVDGRHAPSSTRLQSVGVRVAENAADTVIGGTSAGRRNLIAANGDTGIVVEPDAGATVIRGNWIGLDVTGTASAGNQDVGIALTAADGFVESNVIAGNADRGVAIAGAGGIVVSSNRIGTAADGPGAVPNPYGVEIGAGATDPLVVFNTIRSGAHAGIRLTFGVTGAYLTLNTIEQHGIGVESIGATGGRLLDNTLRNNGVGVSVTEPGTLEIAGNVIAGSTAGLGIDLGAAGVTPNDLGDLDAGPNDLLNFPVPHFAVLDANGLRFGGVYDGSLGSRAYRLELFASAACNIAHHGEGERVLGTADVTTDFTGRAVIDTTVATTAVTAGDWITATITDTGGRTSEFSRCLEARPGTALTAPAARGTSTLLVASNTGFGIGDTVAVCPGCENEEHAVVAGLGSLLLATPLQFDHATGEPVANQGGAATTTTTTTTTTIQATTTTATTTTPPASSTTTTVPGCIAEPTVTSIRCRLAVMHGLVDAANPARIEKGLLARLRTAAARTDAALLTAGTPRKQRTALRAAVRALRAFQQQLRTKTARRVLPGDVRAAWIADAGRMLADLRTALQQR